VCAPYRVWDLRWGSEGSFRLNSFIFILIFYVEFINCYSAT